MIPAKHIEKPWGHETVWADTDKYIGKIIVIFGGKRLSYQYHRQKDETIFLLEGLLEVEFEAEGKRKKVLLKPGESFRNPPAQKHRYIAKEDCKLVEVSTPHMEDVVRLEDDFGRAKES